MNPESAAASGAAAYFPLLRPEFTDDLAAGEHRLRSIMQGDVRTVAPGRPLVVAEQPGNFVFRLRSGWCARARHMRDGRSQIFSLHLPGDLIGTRGLFAQLEMDEVYALGPVELEAVAYARLLGEVKADRTLTLRILSQVIEDDRRLHNWMVAVGRGTAEERLALLLLDLRGRLVLGKMLDADADRFALPMTQMQIGDLLGLTAVHVNRMLRRFREQKIATIARGAAILHDIPQLHRIARPMLDAYEKSRPEFGAPL